MNRLDAFDKAEKLSEILEIALVDFLQVVEDPRFEINMNDWVWDEANICHVCLAGAVLQRKNAVFLSDIGYMGPSDDLPNSVKYRAIDTLRQGRLADAYFSLTWNEPPMSLPQIDVPEFEDEPENFLNHMHQIVFELKEAGL